MVGGGTQTLADLTDLRGVLFSDVFVFRVFGRLGGGCGGVLMDVTELAIDF